MARPKKDIRASYRKEYGRYQIQYIEDPERWHLTPEDTEDAALRWARRNRDRIIVASVKTLSEHILGFFASSGRWAQRMREKGHVYTEKYLETRQGYLDNYIAPEFGDCAPSEITRRQIDDWLLTLKRQSGSTTPLAGATKNKILYTLSIVFEDMVDREVIDRNPISGIRPYSKAPVKPRGVLPQDALERLFPATRGGLVKVWGSTMWAACMLVLLDTGMRPGELRALRWSELHQDISFASGASAWAFVVRHGIEAGTEAKIKTTKNDMVKAVGISELTKQILDCWREETRFAGDGDFIFTQTGVRPITGDGIVIAFRRGLKAAGFESTAWTPYWLRHSFVTNALRLIPVDSIAALAGHSVEVSRQYQHPDDEIVLAKTRAAREAMAGEKKG